MTNEQIYFLTILGMVFFSIVCGIALGYPLWFWKGYVRGLKEAGEIYCGVFDDENDEVSDEILNARRLD